MFSALIAAAALLSPMQIELTARPPAASIVYRAESRDGSAPISLRLSCEKFHLTATLDGVEIADDPGTPLSLDLGNRHRSFTPSQSLPALTGRYLPTKFMMEKLGQQAVMTAQYNGQTYQLHHASLEERTDFSRYCLGMFDSLAQPLDEDKMRIPFVDTPLRDQ